jgi:aerobic carbon-monoxide dehydrogenase small subunit
MRPPHEPPPLQVDVAVIGLAGEVVMQERLVKFEVDGRAVEVDVEPRETLLDVVRERLGLTGAHAGCEHGACGTCTLLVDGVTVRSCLLLAVQCDGVAVTTIEAFAPVFRFPAGEEPQSTELHPVMEAFRRHHAVQCGFCTPAMVLGAIELLAENADPDETTVRRGLAGNLCRCTGYAGIVAAVLAVAATSSSEDHPSEPAPGSETETGSSS